MSEHTQVGPYALGLLDPLEMSRFEEHLAECDECGTQLEWMLPVADLMADVEPGDLYGIDGPSAFSTPGGSVQQSMTMTDPSTRPMTQAQPPGSAPPPYAPLKDLSTPNYPNEIAAGVDPRTGSMPTIDPRTGSMPTVDPRTGSMPAVDPRTGSVPRIDSRTRTPRPDPRTSDMPRVEPAAGENRIVPLVRGGDSRRRNQSRPVPHRPEEMAAPGQRRNGLMLAAAAGILAVGAAVGAGAMVSGPWADQGTQIEAISGPQMKATDGTSGVHADVTVAEKEWGSRVSFTVTEIDGPRKCRLVAVKKDKTAEVLSTWTVPKRGYGKDTQPPTLTLMADTALEIGEIGSFEVQDVTDPNKPITLVTVPAVPA